MAIDNTHVQFVLEIKEKRLEVCLSALCEAGAIITEVSKYSHVGPSPHWYVRLFHLKDMKPAVNEVFLKIEKKGYLIGCPIPDRRRSMSS